MYKKMYMYAGTIIIVPDVCKKNMDKNITFKLSDNKIKLMA